MKCVLSLSGGMDSTSLLLHLLCRGYEVLCLSFDYGQKHKIELEKATELINYLNQDNIRTYKAFDDVLYEKYPLIKHQIIKLDGLSNLLISGLIDNNSMELKQGHYSDVTALTSVVPNRNAIFASIIYAVALSIVKKYNSECLIALGTHMGDFNNKTKQGIYPDCSEEFKQALEYAFKIGNWDSNKVNYYAPYNTIDKTGVLKDGLNSCKKLDLDWKQIYIKTNTSYDPVLCEIEDGETMGFVKTKNIICSDYKTGSSIERIEAFINLGLEDPLIYADKDGIKSWDFVRNYVIKICEEFKQGL